MAVMAALIVTEQQMRESFESWYATRCGHLPERGAGGYGTGPAQIAWESWCNSALAIAVAVQRIVRDADAWSH